MAKKYNNFTFEDGGPFINPFGANDTEPSPLTMNIDDALGMLLANGTEIQDDGSKILPSGML
jgi:hypothetical protein